MNDGICGVYAIRLSDGRAYVGSSAVIRQRWYRHRRLLRKGKHHSPYMQNAWNKHGESAFEFVVLEECGSRLLFEREQFWIDQLKPCFNYAKVAGSRLGVPQSAECKARVSASLIGNQRTKGRKLSSEHKAKIGKAHLGRKNTDVTKEKMSASAKGRVFTAEHRARISASNTGKKKIFAHRKGNPMSAATKAKISAAQAGKPRLYAIGRKNSPETIARMRTVALVNRENRSRVTSICRAA